MTARRTASLALALFAGGLFGVGLLISGMTQPAKVVGFLDIAGAWDPSLAFVMGGAVVVYGIAAHVIPRRGTPWLAGAFDLPTRRDIDVPLLAGSAVFGIGWGLSGFCPGPSIVVAGAGTTTGLAFAAAMLAGMMLQHVTSRRA